MSEVLTLPRMARELGVTRNWLKGQAENGEIPCLPAGTRFLFNPDAVKEALAAKAAQATGPYNGEEAGPCQ